MCSSNPLPHLGEVELLDALARAQLLRLAARDHHQRAAALERARGDRAARVDAAPRARDSDDSHSLSG